VPSVIKSLDELYLPKNIAQNGMIH